MKPILRRSLGDDRDFWIKNYKSYQPMQETWVADLCDSVQYPLEEILEDQILIRICGGVRDRVFDLRMGR